MSALLEVRALAAVADGNWLLRDVTIEVAEGSTVALVGGAGAGKTLLLQLLLGLAERRGGFIRLAGQDIGGLTPGQRQRLGLRCAFQRPPVFPGLDVREHLALAAPSVKLEAHAIERLADLIPELTGCLDQPVSGLDAPLLRLVDLGRALLGLPRVLLIDDLFATIGSARAAALVQALAEQGYTLLVADRYAAPVLAVADRGYVLAQGRLVAAGAPEELLADQRLLFSCAGDPNAYADD
jgi:ABC-type branched-subunit amino acid transport system ATPase component